MTNREWELADLWGAPHSAMRECVVDDALPVMRELGVQVGTRTDLEAMSVEAMNGLQTFLIHYKPEVG